ncbi:MAG TPA: methyl-accepting chemotaxis protein, partial [Desulfuromonadaceae bacterium]
MTIKSKLSFNVCIVIIMIGAVSATSLFGMRFIRERLSYLTERSTPYQLRSAELQLATQGCIAKLVKIGVSRTLEEFGTARAEAENALAAVKKAQDALSALEGTGSSGAYEELTRIEDELFRVTEARLKAEADLNAAGKSIDSQLKAGLVQLKGLDSQIRQFQDTRSAAYATSATETRNISAKLRDAEAMRTVAKDLTQAVSAIDRSPTKKGLLIAKGRYNTIITKLLKNPYLREIPEIKPDIDALGEKAGELAALKATLLDQPDNEARNRYKSLFKELNEKITAFVLAMGQEVATANSNYGVESGKQGTLYGQSNLATKVLAENASLVAQGIYIDALSSKLFSLVSLKDVAAVESALRQEFEKLSGVERNLTGSLKGLGANQELTKLRDVEKRMTAIRTLLFEKEGVIAKIRHGFEMQEQSNAATARLRDIVAQQAEKGNRIASTAQGDQEKAISSVNNMVRFSTMLIIAIGVAAVIFGIIFGIWVYHSISRPLASSIAVVNRIADGHLNVTLESGRKDEIGQLLDAIERMSASLRELIANVLRASEAITGASGQLLK